MERTSDSNLGVVARDASVVVGFATQNGRRASLAPTWVLYATTVVGFSTQNGGEG